jgi:hypothetical protein
MQDEGRRVQQQQYNRVWDQWDGDRNPFPEIDEVNEFELQQENLAFAEQERRRELSLDSAIDNIRKQSIPRLLRTIREADDGPHILSFHVEIEDCGWTGRSLFALCLWAIPTRKLRILLKSLETAYPNVWSWQLGDGYETLLHLAAKENPPYYVLRLVAEMGDARLIGNPWGEFPIHYACQNENVTQECLSQLIDAEQIALLQRDFHGAAPMHHAFATFAQGQGSKKSIQQMNWLIQLYPKGQHVCDREDKTPLMKALELCCYRSDPTPPDIVLQLNRVAAAAPTSLYTTDTLSDVEPVRSTALHCVVSNFLPRLNLVNLIIANDELQPRRVDLRGDLPLHALCRSFAAADQTNDILAILDILHRNFASGLRHRNNEGLTPIHLAILSRRTARHAAEIPPLHEMISLIRAVTADSIRGHDMRSRGTTRTASCLEYAYRYWPDPDLLTVLYDLSPIDILMIESDDASRHGDREEYERRSDASFLAVMEIALHPTVQTKAKTAIRRFLTRYYEDIARLESHTISHILSQPPRLDQIRDHREYLTGDSSFRQFLYEDLAPRRGCLGRMVQCMLRANTAGRNKKPIALFTHEDHYQILLILQDDASSLYLHFHDVLACTGRLPFMR